MNAELSQETLKIDMQKELDKAVETEEQLMLDVMVYGNSFHTTDEFGLKTRIDPLTILPEEIIQLVNDHA